MNAMRFVIGYIMAVIAAGLLVWSLLAVGGLNAHYVGGPQPLICVPYLSVICAFAAYYILKGKP